MRKPNGFHHEAHRSGTKDGIGPLPGLAWGSMGMDQMQLLLGEVDPHRCRSACLALGRAGTRPSAGGGGARSAATVGLSAETRRTRRTVSLLDLGRPARTRSGRDGFAAGHSDGPKNPAFLVCPPSASPNVIRGQDLRSLRCGTRSGGLTADSVNSADNHGVRWERHERLVPFPPPTVPRTFTDSLGGR